MTFKAPRTHVLFQSKGGMDVFSQMRTKSTAVSKLDVTGGKSIAGKLLFTSGVVALKILLRFLQ
jgi:hypothetical protein